MKFISWLSQGNRESGTFATDLEIVAAIRWVRANWAGDVAITHTMDMSALDFQRWEAEGGQTVTNKKIMAANIQQRGA